MTATNHFLIGVSISLVVKQPLLALPLAFVSHLVADAMPHYGGNAPFSQIKKVWMLDAFLLSIVLLGTWYYFGVYNVLVGFIATSPDLVWVYRFLFQEKAGKLPKKPKSGFNKFHADVQKYEKHYNWPFEILYAALSLLFIRSVG